jgi:type II secretory pathway component PulF
MFSPQIKLPQLVQLCRRLALSYSTGIDAKKTWQRESESGIGSFRLNTSKIAHEVAKGQSLAESIKVTGNYFPALFRELVEIGEHTGRLSEVFERLADYYEFVQDLRRTMFRSMIYPALQLFAAVSVIGLLILILGLIPQADGPDAMKFDPTGFGLIGVSGFFKYLAILGVLAGAGAFLYVSVERGWLRIDPLMSLVMHIPALGKFLENMALARLSWALGLGFDTGLDAKRMVRLAMKSSGNPYYSSRSQEVEISVARHGEFHEAFKQVGVFPPEFIDVLRTGEVSGSIGAAMTRMTREYESRARLLGHSLTIVFGFFVGAIVAAIIIYFIFQLAFQYIGMLQNAGGPI